jgi:ankyrin repeat protein
LSNGIAKIGNKTANLLITNSSKALNFLKNHPVAAGATVLGIVFGLYKLRSNRQPKQLNHAHLEARDNLEEIQPKLTFLQMIKNNQVKEVEQALLKEEADVNQQDELGLTTPLISAVYLENIEIVELLLKNGADPNFQSNNNGWTALLTAAATNNLDIVKLLLQNGANPDMQTAKHQTAYDLGNDKIKETIAEFKQQKLKKIKTILNDSTISPLPPNLADLIEQFTY